MAKKAVAQKEPVKVREKNWPMETSACTLISIETGNGTKSTLNCT